MTYDDILPLAGIDAGYSQAVARITPITDPKERAKIEAWIAALRSGTYAQTTGTLCRTTDRSDDLGRKYKAGYCCLGVYAHAVLNIAPDALGYCMPPNKWQTAPYGWEGESLPGAFPREFSESLQCFFAFLNDNLAFTFAQIADVAQILFLDPREEKATAA